MNKSGATGGAFVVFAVNHHAKNGANGHQVLQIRPARAKVRTQFMRFFSWHRSGTQGHQSSQMLAGQE